MFMVQIVLMSFIRTALATVVNELVVA